MVRFYQSIEGECWNFWALHYFIWRQFDQSLSASFSIDLDTFLTFLYQAVYVMLWDRLRRQIVPEDQRLGLMTSA